MKLYDMFVNQKEEYLDAIILIESGKFYVTFDNDSFILSYLFKYKKINNRVGFPNNTLNSVLSKLEEYNINYILNSEIKNINLENHYYDYLQKANDDFITSNMCNNLLSKIKTKVSENFNNYSKIKDFLDGL